MKDRPARKRWDAFSVISVCVAFLIIVMIGSAILFILIGGIPHLGAALASEEIRFALRMSLATATVSTLLCIVLSLFAAYAFTRTDMPFKRTAEVILELSMCLPYIVIGLSLLILFSTGFGKWLKGLGFRVVFDRKGIVLAQLFVNLPFTLHMIRTALLQVDTRLEAIAGMLGASRWKQFLTITLPLCKNSLISAAVLTWSRGVGEFGATLMLVGVTRMKTETLPGSIFLNISAGENGMAMAAATIMLLISCVSLALSNGLSRTPRYYRLNGKR